MYLITCDERSFILHMNSKVNEEVREWVHGTLIEAIGIAETTSVDISKDTKLGDMYYEVGKVYGSKIQIQ